jgi:hypothetical protein
MEISTTNYGKPTPYLLKLIADLGLVLALITETMPEFKGRQWVIFGVIAFKLLTNFFVEHPKPTS